MRPWPEIIADRRLKVLDFGPDLSGEFPGSQSLAGRIMIARTLLRVIASDGGGWDHVSVSVQHRIPRWVEMQFVHRLFFRDDEAAMQLHVPASDHVNVHRNCLHLWRPQGVPVPLPPKEFV